MKHLMKHLLLFITAGILQSSYASTQTLSCTGEWHSYIAGVELRDFTKETGAFRDLIYDPSTRKHYLNYLDSSQKKHTALFTWESRQLTPVTLPKYPDAELTVHSVLDNGQVITGIENADKHPLGWFCSGNTKVWHFPTGSNTSSNISNIANLKLSYVVKPGYFPGFIWMQPVWETDQPATSLAAPNPTGMNIASYLSQLPDGNYSFNQNQAALLQEPLFRETWPEHVTIRGMPDQNSLLSDVDYLDNKSSSILLQRNSTANNTSYTITGMTGQSIAFIAPLNITGKAGYLYANFSDDTIRSQQVKPFSQWLAPGPTQFTAGSANLLKTPKRSSCSYYHSGDTGYVYRYCHQKGFSSWITTSSGIVEDFKLFSAAQGAGLFFGTAEDIQISSITVNPRKQQIIMGRASNAGAPSLFRLTCTPAKSRE